MIIQHLLWIYCQIRFAQYLLQFIANTIIPDHDAHVFNPPLWSLNNGTILDICIDKFFSGLRRWDAIHFLHIARFGYIYENSLAFFPGYPLLFIRPLAYIFNQFLIESNAYLLSAILINFFIGLCNTYLIFKLGLKYKLKFHHAYWSSILYIINPATIFFLAPYSETLFLFSQLLGHNYLKQNKIFYSYLCFGFGSIIRSNGIISFGFIIYYYLRKIYHKRQLIFPIHYFILCILPFFFTQYFLYKEYCYEKKIPQELKIYGFNNDLSMPLENFSSIWCLKQIPLSYQYVQKKYWNMGFLNYWTWKQIPNFLLALPVFILIGNFIQNWFKIIRKDLWKKKFEYLFSYKNQSRNNIWFEKNDFIPHIIYMLFLSLFALFFMHIQTAEEIREHTIPEDLPPVEKTLAMLDSRCDIQRIAGIRSIPSIIISHRDGTFHRVLPKFKLIIEQTVDSGEHAVAAETIVSMIQQQSLSYSEFMSLFSQMICALIFPTTTNRFSIDFGDIWCQALCNIIDAFPKTTSFTSLLDLIFNNSLHGSYVRDRLAIILAKLSCRLNSQIVENRLLPVFKNFINDTNADIRALACQKLPILAQSLEYNQILNLILPLLVTLSKDDNLAVRQTCFESLLDLSNNLNDSRSIQQVNEMIISLIKFGLSSRTSKFITTIALHLSDLCHTLSIFQIDECKFVHEIFLRLSQEKNFPECRLSCAKHFSSIIDYLGHDELSNELEKLFSDLCNDKDSKICSIMPSTIINLTKLYDNNNNNNNAEKKYMSIIWNGFLSLLNNSNYHVMIALATNLLNIFIKFSRNQDEGLLYGSICSMSAIPDSEIFINQLLEYERRIFENTLSWRSCILCLQAFVHLPYLLSSEQIQTKILPCVFSRIYSKQVCVREIAVDSYVQLLRKIPRRSIRKNAFQKLKTELLLNKSYQWRIMYIRVCRQILVHYSKRFFKENFLDTILSIEYDPVLSVRIQLVPLLIEIKSILRLPADRQSISKIETMMEYFLADKTLTLHDLANNGLLQLDQIRSYNTLSIFSNHTSDDNNDKKKEDEEYFLDEIDASKRRSLNKSNDQYTISKRLTDTSISNKQTTSLRSAQLVKTNLDILPRKSSLPSDTSNEIKDNKISLTKQRRRQTLNDNTVSTTSSRLSNQTPTKKNFKYSHIFFSRIYIPHNY
ncbi:unnamed protein product [Rotaria sp. Silwood1]|nr:unnamed protein product [Rotaria sp. Silwood1]